MNKILTIVSAAALSAVMIQSATAANTASFKKSKTEAGGSIIYYKGETTIKGTIDVRAPDDEMMPCNLCFHVDKKDFKKIPRAKGDDRDPWFAFSNERFNKAANSYQVLGLKVRADKCYQPIPATVKIRNYKEDMQETETVDETTLVKIVSMGTPKVTTCKSNW